MISVIHQAQFVSDERYYAVTFLKVRLMSEPENTFTSCERRTYLNQFSVIQHENKGTVSSTAGTELLQQYQVRLEG